MSIKFYRIKDPYGEFSNFKKAPMFIYGRWWKNVEAAYQSRKTDRIDEIDKIHQANKPMEARDLGQIISMRSDWDSIKYDVMKECLIAKFTQHADLRQLLLSTENEVLIEDSPIDWYWGCGSDDAGKNKLGQALMEVRNLLRNNTFPGQIL